MSRFVYIAALLLLSGAAAWLLWWSDVPLGVPGEWTWERISYGGGGSLAGTLVGPAVAIAAAGLYVLVCWAAGRRIAHRSGRVGSAARLTLLTLAAWALLLTIAAAPPPGHDLARMPIVLYDAGASGYFTLARYGDNGEPIDVPEFLATYEERMGGGDVLHIGTHPPGLMLAHRGLIELCRGAPVVTRTVLATAPGSVRDAFDVLNRGARIGPPLAESDRAALWLAVLATQLVAAATVVPLYLLVRRYLPRAESWRAACLWPLVPAVIVFLPKSDALFPFLGTLFLWLWLEGCARGSLVRGAAAGVVLWAGMFLSLAMLPVVAAGGVLAIWEWWWAPALGPGSSATRRLLAGVAGAAAGWLTPVAVLWLAYDVNLLNVWLWNYRNHAGFYDEYPRTWWKWLLVNPVELALAAGAPLVVAAVAGGWRSVRADATRGADWREADALHTPVPASPRPSFPRLFRAGPLVGCLLVWSIVWVWGKNMGEAARLWLVFQPWLVWIAAGAFGGSDTAAGTRRDDAARRWLWTMGLQAMVCVGTVMRVSGFHYLNPEPAAPPGVTQADGSGRDEIAAQAGEGRFAAGRVASHGGRAGVR